MHRLVKAVYHPRNQYLLHLDADALDLERAELAISEQSNRVFQAFENVHVVGKSFALNHVGSSMVAATLHAAALLLKISSDWDWFITLTASDYPLISQDDLLHALAFLPRDLNFIRFTNKTNKKEQKRTNQIVVDPSLYFEKRTQIFYAGETRPTPDAFKIYEGPPWVVLTRAFMEFCVEGLENLPRKLLMYFSNVPNPTSYYFHTVLCNSPQFQNSTANIDLRHIIKPPRANSDDGQLLSMSVYNTSITSRAAFAGPFRQDIGDQLVISMIDDNVLHRPPNEIVPGEWCFPKGMEEGHEDGPASRTSGVEDVCITSWGESDIPISDIDAIKAGPYGMQLRAFLSKLHAQGKLTTSHCH